MTHVYSPTPHRIALCALARYLSRDDDDEDQAESILQVNDDDERDVANLNNNNNRNNGSGFFSARDRPRTRLGPRDRRRLARLLMEEMTAVDGFREPSIRDFKARLDAFSRAGGAPPAKPEVQMPSAMVRGRSERGCGSIQQLGGGDPFLFSRSFFSNAALKSELHITQPPPSRARIHAPPRRDNLDQRERQSERAFRPKVRICVERGLK